MKRFFLALMLCCAAVSLTAAPLPKKISVGKKSIMQLKPGNFVIVIPAKAIPVVKFAASELQKFLSQSMDSKIPVVTVPESGKINIHVGMTAEAKKAGIDLSKLVRDGFYIRTSGKNIFIAGIDDPKKNPVHEIKTGGGWSILYEHATIFGVYDFLERFAGMRFYFEGELGTIVPKNKVLNIPEINIVERPDFTVRSYSAFYDGEYFEGPKPKATINPKKNINLYRNRFHTMSMPCCHGIQGFGMLHRFGESNPEYFALASNGRRLNDPNVRFPGQLCWSSNVREEIYKDVEAYLKGRPAKERGVV